MPFKSPKRCMKKTWFTRAASATLAVLGAAAWSSTAAAQASSDVRSLEVRVTSEVPASSISDGESNRSVRFNIAQCLDVVDATASTTLTWTFELASPSGQYRVAYIAPGEDCDNTSLDSGDQGCETVETARSISGNTVAHTLELDDLFDDTARDDCYGGTDLSYGVAMMHSAQGVDPSDDVRKDEVNFELNLTRPVGDIVPDLDPGESRIEVRWMPIDGITDYAIYYSTDEAAFAASTPEERVDGLRVTTREGLDDDASSVTATISSGISLGERYYVMVVPVNREGNPGLLTNTIVEGVAQPTNDFWEAYRGAGGVEQGGYCGAAGGAAGAWWLIAGWIPWARRRRTSGGGQ